MERQKLASSGPSYPTAGWGVEPPHSQAFWNLRCARYRVRASRESCLLTATRRVRAVCARFTEGQIEARRGDMNLLQVDEPVLA